MWNRNQGVSADIALYCTLMLALAHIYAARKLLEREAVSVPRLICAIHFGSHYEYYKGSAASSSATSPSISRSWRPRRCPISC